MPFPPKGSSLDDARDKLRDRVKTRHFEKLWSTYTSAFKDFYASLSRSAKTELINDGIVMGKDGHYENQIMKQFKVSESHRKLKEKEFGWQSSGKIQEEAETILGGRANLEAALRRGAVQMSTHSGIQLFHIPTAQALLKEKFEHSVGTEGASTTNEDVHEAMGAQGASMPTPDGSSALPSSSTSLPLPPSSPLSSIGSCAAQMPMSSIGPCGPLPMPSCGSCGPLPLTLSAPPLDALSLGSRAEGPY